MPQRRRIVQPAQMELIPAEPSAINTNTLLPGYLVGLKTSVTGNVQYNKEVVENERLTRTGAARMTWQTERVIADPEEHKKASQVRMKIRAIICSVCAKSAFGLLCPKNALPKLEIAVREAERIAKAFNRGARLTQVDIKVLKGEIANNDLDAARAIKSEVRDLLRIMSEGVRNLNAKEVRDAANKLRDVGSMLSPEASTKIKETIETARKAARKITKAGETAAQEIDQAAITTITQARTAFLDVDEPLEEIGSVETEARAVDLDPDAASDAPDDGSYTDDPRLATPVTTGRTRSASPAQSNPPRVGRYTGKRKAAKKAAPTPKKRKARA